MTKLGHAVSIVTVVAGVAASVVNNMEVVVAVGAVVLVRSPEVDDRSAITMIFIDCTSTDILYRHFRVLVGIIGLLPHVGRSPMIHHGSILFDGGLDDYLFFIGVIGFGLGQVAGICQSTGVLVSRIAVSVVMAA